MCRACIAVFLCYQGFTLLVMTKLSARVYTFRYDQVPPFVECLYLGHLDLWDLQSLKPSHSVDCHSGPIWCIAENPTSPEQVAVCSEDGMVCKVLCQLLFLFFYTQI